MFLILPIHVSALSTLIGDIKLVNGKWCQSVSLFLQWSIEWLRGSLYTALSGFELVVILLSLPPWGRNHRCVLPCLASSTLFWMGDTAQQKSCGEKQKRKTSLQVFAGALAQHAQCRKERKKERMAYPKTTALLGNYQMSLRSPGQVRWMSHCVIQICRTAKLDWILFSWC